MPQVSGTALMQSSNVATKVRLLRVDDGEFEAETVPDVGTGAYSITVPLIADYFVVATLSGERALAHGPVTAVEP